VADNIAQGDLIRLIVLAAELITSLSLSAITLSKSVRLAGSGVLNDSSLVTPNGPDSAVTSEAIASIVIFSIMGVVYVAIAAACFVCLLRCKNSTLQKICKENVARSFSKHEWRCLHTATLKMWQWRSQDTEVAWAQELHAAGQHIEAHSADLSSCSAKK